MKFVREPVEMAESAVAVALARALAARQPVLWLVSGGSNITSEVRIMQRLHETAAEYLSYLTVLPMDERYGPPGHTDSNTAQLKAAGFTPGIARWHDVLAGNLPLEETAAYYDNLASALLDAASIVIGLFGLGADGHTAGILPHSPVLTEVSFTAFSYEASDYTRLTLTVPALKRCAEAYLLAYGAAKEPALRELQTGAKPLADMPARLLEDIPVATVYNEYISGGNDT